MSVSASGKPPTEITRRVYVSMTADSPLPAKTNSLKWSIVKRVEDLGFVTEIFGPPTARRGLASGRSWHIDDVDRVARRCIGGVVIGLPRWRLKNETGQEILIASEYCQYEAAVLHTLGLPLLILADRDLAKRCVFTGLTRNASLGIIGQTVCIRRTGPSGARKARPRNRLRPPSRAPCSRRRCWRGSIPILARDARWP
ncbi:MAG: hypothetical protein QOH65_674 [Methylobacteriaceae bacterium]|nr:hypothetical protein [Methylobacteriaceae bacterium]